MPRDACMEHAAGIQHMRACPPDEHRLLTMAVASMQDWLKKMLAGRTVNVSMV